MVDGTVIPAKAGTQGYATRAWERRWQVAMVTLEEFIADFTPQEIHVRLARFPEEPQ